MSTSKNNHNDKSCFLEPNPSHYEVRQLHLYYIHLHDRKVEFTLKADFGNEIGFTFSEGKQLDDNNSSPFIYTLNLDLIMDKNDNLCLRHEDQFKPVSAYFLKISHVTSLKTMATHEEKRHTEHSLIRVDFSEKHFFLFDIRFRLYHGFHLPGKTHVKSVRN